MVDIRGKSIITESDEESEKLLRYAVAQGYALPKGLKAMVGKRQFRFMASPYRCIQDEVKNPIKYKDLFGRHDNAFKKILKDVNAFCKEYDYSIIRIYCDQNEDDFETSGYAKTCDNTTCAMKDTISKPKKVTLAEVEEILGYPIEIVS